MPKRDQILRIECERRFENGTCFLMSPSLEQCLPVHDVPAHMAGLLREHIRWEESVLFERAQTELKEGELRLLGEDLSLRIPEIPESPPWQ